MVLNYLKKLVKKDSKWIETTSNKSLINKVVTGVCNKTDLLIWTMNLKNSTLKFNWCVQLLLPSKDCEDYKKSNWVEDICLLNVIVNDSENLLKEIYEEDDLLFLYWYMSDIKKVIEINWELVKSNSHIEKGLNNLIQKIICKINTEYSIQYESDKKI